ncbi:MAG: DUF308 domain-containing protein [Clostridia bacterium]|nr:DUF308 domain-containing protein [Clostridia bacterium]
MIDEEYSYSGYSPETEKELKEQTGYIPDEEEFAYTSYSSKNAKFDEESVQTIDKVKEIYNEKSRSLTVAEGVETVERPHYGDFLVEEFSHHNNFERVSKYVNLPHHVLKYVFAVIYFIVGVVCIAFNSTVSTVLPYIVGGVMVLGGVAKFLKGIIKKDYLKPKKNVATSIIFAALGVMIIIEAQSGWSMQLIAAVWGVFGLMEGGHALNKMIVKIHNGEPFIYYVIKGIVECVLAFLLLHDPTHIETHIIVLGINMIFDAITMLPQFKKFVNKL